MTVAQYRCRCRLRLWRSRCDRVGAREVEPQTIAPDRLYDYECGEAGAVGVREVEPQTIAPDRVYDDDNGKTGAIGSVLEKLSPIPSPLTDCIIMIMVRPVR